MSLTLLFCTCFLLVRSQKTVKGFILNEEGEGISNATVQIVNSLNGTSSDNDGFFELRNFEFPIVLKISAIGYIDHIDTLKKENETISIALIKQIYIADEFIVSATRAEKSHPFTYTNISEAELAEMNIGRDVPYILNQTNSLVAISDAGSGIGYTGLRIRGIDQTNINVTINGIALNDAESHNVFWVDIPDFASSLSSVQIQRGIGTSTNGAGAFGATINLQTEEMNVVPFAEIGLAGGSFNSMKGMLSFGSGVINKYWTFDGRVSMINSDGYIDRATSDLRSYFLSSGFNNGKTSIKAIAFGGVERTYQAWNGIDKTTLENDRTYNSSGEIKNPDGSVSFYDNQIDNYTQDHFQIHLNQLISKRLHLNIAGHYTYGRGYFESYHQSDYLSSYGIPDIIVGPDSFSTADIIDQAWLDNHYFGFTYNVRYNVPGFTVDLGGGLSRYDGDHFGEILWMDLPYANYGQRYYFNNALKDDFNSYLKITKKISSKINTLFDVQWRIVSYKVLGDAQYYGNLDFSDRLNFLNPKAGLSFAINENQSAYYSLALAHREPNRNDYLNADNFNAKPERLFDQELGYRYSFAGLEFNSNVYFMYYEDQLVLTGEIDNFGAALRSNVGKSYRAGVELSAKINLLSKLKWSPNITFSRNRNLDFIFADEQGDLTEVESSLAYSPEYIVNNALSYQVFKPVFVTLYSYLIGEQFLDNTGKEESKLNSYMYHDLRLEYRTKMRGVNSFSTFLNINNVLDEKYSSNGYMWGDTAIFFPQAGINFMAGINLAF